MKDETTKRAEQIVTDCEEGYFSYLNDAGYPETATRSNIRPEGIRNFIFVTGVSEPMAKSLIRDGRSSVCFRQEGNNVTLVGDTELIEDQKEKKELWQEWFINHFPGGPEDPEYCVLQFTTRSASLWVDRKQLRLSREEISLM